MVWVFWARADGLAGALICGEAGDGTCAITFLKVSLPGHGCRNFVIWDILASRKSKSAGAQGKKEVYDGRGVHVLLFAGDS